MNKEKWNKFGWGVLKTLTIAILNSVLIFFVIAKIIGFEIVINNRNVEINLIDYWKWLGVWKWYYSLLMYVGIFAGLFGTFKIFGVWHNIKKEKVNDKKNEKFKNDIKKILGGK